MPYAPTLNARAMLSNIASIEIPPVVETLSAWLTRQEDADLARMEVPRERIDDRAFYPRIVLGEFFRAQLALVVARARTRGHVVTVETGQRVVDIEPGPDDIAVAAENGVGETQHHAFGHVVMATGHSWPDWTEERPGYFTSPWPATTLRAIRNVHVGIRGTSLSGIDALVAVASNHGAFLLDAGGVLQWHPGPDTDEFRVTMMSRKGLFPEADFHFPIPYDDNVVCTPEAIEAVIASGRPDVLDAIFALFAQELALADPDYAAAIGLASLDADTIAAAYFGQRDEEDPFLWAARNLAEARANYEDKVTVPWRYAILRMHEVVALAVPHLSAEDLKRFHGGLREVFIDDYATVPHESIERILALRRAGRLDILALGSDYDLDAKAEATGAVLTYSGGRIHFPAFIEAMGQRALTLDDLPFPSLLASGAVRPARSQGPRIDWGDGPDDGEETAGIDLDEAFRPVSETGLHGSLYCLGLPFLLHRMPFTQGITSSHEMAQIVAGAILGQSSESSLILAA